MPDFLSEAQTLFPYTQTLRRDFHQHPELGFQEVRTAGIVARELRDLGLEVSTGIAETGVVAIIEGGGHRADGTPGPVALLRFDMDALPIHEETGAPYASQTPGVMHACGHDGHTAIGLTVAKMLHAHRDELAGTVKLVFQPAEEGLGGAARMVKEGVLSNPRPDMSFALHLWNDKPFGWLGITPGPAMAASGRFQITVTGSGGHGAAPHTTRDPIIAATQIITAFQTIVARNVPPLDSAVVSVTAIEAGEAFNVIPSTATMKGTFRTYRPAVHGLLKERMKKIAVGIAEAMGCSTEIEFWEITPTVDNDPTLTAKIQAIAARLFPDAVIDPEERTMGSEDMAYMMQDVPGCYFFIGSNNAEAHLNAPHHHPKFDFDERTLSRAAGMMATVAAEFLS
ncbi:MAG: amidohydrolase [Anaerolineales bacterium]|nr:amidohydrolase [Anaerolineales bacterium]